MIWKIYDWIAFFDGLKKDFGFYRGMFGWKKVPGFVKASVMDLLFYGGRVCNWHGSFMCAKCYSAEERKKVFDEISCCRTSVNETTY